MIAEWETFSFAQLKGKIVIYTFRKLRHVWIVIGNWEDWTPHKS